MGKHGLGALAAMDAALREYYEVGISDDVSDVVSGLSEAQASIPMMSDVLTGLNTLYYNFGSQFMRNHDERRMLYDDFIATADDIVFFCSKRTELLSLLNDERKCGEAPTTPRSIPPQEHLNDSLDKLQNTFEQVWQNILKRKHFSYFKKKKCKVAINKVRSYLTRVSDKTFMKTLVLNDSWQFCKHRRELSNHLRCVLLELNIPEPGSHTVVGGVCCQMHGCRRSAVRGGLCPGHGLQMVDRLKTSHCDAFVLNDPIHRSSLQKWLIKHGDRMNARRLRFWCAVEDFKTCNRRGKVRGERAQMIYKKYIAVIEEANFEDTRPLTTGTLGTSRSNMCFTERAILCAQECTQEHLARTICSEFFKSNEFQHHVDTLRNTLSSPRSGRRSRYEWPTPGRVALYDGIVLSSTEILKSQTRTCPPIKLCISSLVGQQAAQRSSDMSCHSNGSTTTETSSISSMSSDSCCSRASKSSSSAEDDQVEKYEERQFESSIYKDTRLKCAQWKQERKRK